jgi:hypothetical protein
MRPAVILLSSVVGFLSTAPAQLVVPVSGAVLVGGDASFQRGGIFAAAPWRGIKTTPSTFRARLLGGAWVVEMAKRKHLSLRTWCSRLVRKGIRFSKDLRLHKIVIPL